MHDELNQTLQFLPAVNCGRGFAGAIKCLIDSDREPRS
jgi:hypothetical protein